jgi:hypothetical protein
MRTRTFARLPTLPVPSDRWANAIPSTEYCASRPKVGAKKMNLCRATPKALSEVMYASELIRSAHINPKMQSTSILTSFPSELLATKMDGHVSNRFLQRSPLWPLLPYTSPGTCVTAIRLRNSSLSTMSQMPSIATQYTAIQRSPTPSTRIEGGMKSDSKSYHLETVSASALHILVLWLLLLSHAGYAGSEDLEAVNASRSQAALHRPSRRNKEKGFAVLAG